MTGEGITKYKVCTCVNIAELGMIFCRNLIELVLFLVAPNKNVHLYNNI